MKDLQCGAGVLFAGRADGLVEAWDLLDCSHQPVLVSAASTAAVTSLCFSPDAPATPAAMKVSTQQLLAVGGCSGLPLPITSYARICCHYFACSLTRRISSLQGLELPISLFCLCLHHSLPHFLILKGLLQPGRRTDIFRVAIFTTTSPFPRDSRGLKVGKCSKTCIVMSTSARHSSLNAVTSQLPMPDFYDVKCR